MLPLATACLLRGLSTPTPAPQGSVHWEWGLDIQGLGCDSGCVGDPQVKLFILDLSAMLASLPLTVPTAPAP